MRKYTIKLNFFNTNMNFSNTSYAYTIQEKSRKYQGMFKVHSLEK